MQIEEKVSTHAFWSKNSCIQVAHGVWANLTLMTVGFAYEFTAVSVPQFIGSQSKFSFTTNEEAWIVSVLHLTSPIGCLINGYIMDKFGRKVSLLVCQVPLCFGWLCTGYADSTNSLIIGRLITGIGCGMAMNGPRIYLAEITLPSMRGFVGAFPDLAVSVGITFQAIIGTFLSWYVLCYICATYTFIVFIINNYLPETPYFLLMRWNFRKAKESLKKLRSTKHDLKREMKRLIIYKEQNDIRRLSRKEKCKAIMTRNSYEPFAFIIIYILIVQASGVSILTMWSVNILKKSKSSIEAKLGNVILGLTRVASGVVVSILLYKFPRKALAITSAFGVGITCIILCLYIIESKTATAMPQIFYTTYIFFASLGHYNMPYLLMSELYPLQIRGVLSGITVCLANLITFMATLSFPYLKIWIGISHTLLIFGICSLLGFIYLYFYMPETKDLSLPEIEESYKRTDSKRSSIFSAPLSRKLSMKPKPTRSSHDTKMMQIVYGGYKDVQIKDEPESSIGAGTSADSKDKVIDDKNISKTK